MSQKSVDRIIRAGAKALVLADGNPPTDRVLREYMDDATVSLRAALGEAVKSRWSLEELHAAVAAAARQGDAPIGERRHSTASR